MGEILCKRLHIDQKDLSKTSLFFLFGFLAIFSYYLIKPSKDSLFIQYMGSESMPTAFIIIPAVTLIFLFVYDYFVRKYERKIFGVLLIAFFISDILIFWLLFNLGFKKYAVYGLYIWSDVFSVTLVTFFWSFTNDSFNSELAKKVYGILGIGAQLGGVLGSFLTRKIAGLTGASNIILFSIPVLILIALLIKKIDGVAPQTAINRRSDEGSNPDELPSQKKLADIGKNFLMVIRSRHLFYLTLLLCTMLLCSNLLNYQIGRILEISVADERAKTAFYAGRYFQSTSLSVVFLLFASYFYKYLGIFGTLYTLPSFNLLTVTLFLFCPTLSFVAFSKVFDEGLKYGIIQVTREMLYIPCSKEEKYRAKAVIDILFYRVTKVLSGLLMIFFSHVIVLSIAHFNFVIIGILAANMLVLLRLREAYIERLEKKINIVFDENFEYLNIRTLDAPGEPFDEAGILAKLWTGIRERERDASGKAGFAEVISSELPLLAAVDSALHRNDMVKKVILLISRFYEDTLIYSLCMQYLALTLPSEARKKYLTLLSRLSCAEKVA